MQRESACVRHAVFNFHLLIKCVYQYRRASEKSMRRASHAAAAASRGRGKSVSQKSDPQRYWLRSAAGGDELCARTPVWASPKAAQTAPLPPMTSPSAPVGSGRAARTDRRYRRRRPRCWHPSVSDGRVRVRGLCAFQGFRRYRHRRRRRNRRRRRWEQHTAVISLNERTFFHFSRDRNFAGFFSLFL